MADINDPSSASLRLSNDERERAVAALQSQASQGRLTPAELESRSAAARSAATRGDLDPLFADLPVRPQFDPHHGGAQEGQQDPQQPYAASQQPYAAPQQPYPPQGYTQPPQQGYGWGGQERPNSRWGLLIVSIIPFVSLILFFVTGVVWGYQYSWLWFLLIPLVGAIVYGTDGGRRR